MNLKFLQLSESDRKLYIDLSLSPQFLKLEQAGTSRNQANKWMAKAEKPTPDRFSRHYADTAALAGHSIALQAISRDDLRERVVSWKSQFFGSGWASYDTAKPGSFKLVPPESRIADLRRDYQNMRDMYLVEPVSFDEIITTLAALEQRINSK